MRHMQTLIDAKQFKAAQELPSAAERLIGPISALIAEARAREAVAGVEALIAAYDFETALQQIELLERSDPAGGQRLRQLIETVQKRRRIAATAREQVAARLEQGEEYAALQAAITTLDQALDQLPPEDGERASLQTMRDSLAARGRRLFRSTADQKLREAREHLAHRRFAEAATALHEATTSNDAEIRQQVETLRQRMHAQIAETREQLIQDSLQLLERRDLQATTLAQQINRMLGAQSWDTPVPAGFADALKRLQDAFTQLRPVEVELLRAVAALQEARKTGGELEDAFELVKTASSMQAGSSFGHLLLLDSPEGLARRLARCDKLLARAREVSRMLQQRIQATTAFEPALVRAELATLAAQEEGLVRELHELVAQGVQLTLPESWSERYPLHVRLARAIREAHEALSAQLQSRMPMEEALQLSVRRSNLVTLLELVDRNDETALRKNLTRLSGDPE